MLALWGCVLLAAACAHRVEKSAETPPFPSPPPPPPPPPAPALLSQKADSLNSTALYPVNTTSTSKKIKAATSWKIETTFGEPKLDSNSTGSKEVLAVDRPGNGNSSEFRGSQQLGNFVEEDSLEAGGGLRPTHQSGEFGGHRPTFQSEEFGRNRPTNGPSGDFAGAIKRPPTGFVQSLKDHKFPKESFKQFDFPYKLESPILTRVKDGWKPTAGLESHPTDESPIQVPAGGLYTLPDPFKIKPGTTEEDFGLEFSHDDKPHDVIKKPRANPLKNLLHLLTALIPVGIIFSALTPSVITVGPDPANPFRRADGSLAPPSPPPPPPPISERCRRRLLCELHSQTNYPYSPLPARNVRGKQCYRVRCEDPEGMARTLQWLLAHQPPTERPTAGYAPNAPTGDQWDHYT